MKKEVVKMEGSLGSTSFADHISSGYQFQGMLDFPESEKSSVGFMELLGMQDFSPSLFDMLQVPSMVPSSAPNPATAKIEKLEGLNQPATPNSSSISSESSEAVNDEQTKAVDQEEEEQKTKKQLKPKKTAQKRQREPRFAFMTKSEVDHLEDGYRWRKYGQKAVKNSPFPRSYYRCTTASCNVKKRVERSFSDPSVVVTTYEGQHIHPSPAMPRAGAPMGSSVFAGGGGGAFAMPMQGSILSHYQQYLQKPLGNNFSPLNFGYSGGGGGAVANYPSFVNQERSVCTPGSALLRDHGLLQDIVPSNMLKELKE